MKERKDFWLNSVWGEKGFWSELVKIYKMLTKVKEIVLDSIFPDICLCGRWGIALCDDCLAEIPNGKKELCPICLCLSENGKTCSGCRKKSNLTGVLVFGKHEKILKDVVWRYKYDFIKSLNKPLSRLLTQKYQTFLKSKTYLVTNVPISKSRLNWRGFNQAAEIGKIIAENMELEYADLLGKKETQPQVGLKRKERINNIKDKIYMKKAGVDLKNKKILIIDDVYTSGSTLEECARILRAAGAREVWGMVLSRD